MKQQRGLRPCAKHAPYNNSVPRSASQSRCRVKVKGKGSGQECPLYTNNAFTPLAAGSALSHVRIIIVTPRTDAS
jgi:hypothetical protein